jgi:hypothetical protein
MDDLGELDSAIDVILHSEDDIARRVEMQQRRALYDRAAEMLAFHAEAAGSDDELPGADGIVMDADDVDLTHDDPVECADIWDESGGLKPEVQAIVDDIRKQPRARIDKESLDELFLTGYVEAMLSPDVRGG